MTNYPTSLDTLTTGIGTDTQALSTPDHPTQHTNECLAIQALEAKVGVDSSAVATSLDYLVKNTSSSDPGHKHTLASLSDFNVSGSSVGQFLVYNGSKWANSLPNIKFGGTGSDGALSITSGTTTIDCANAAVVVKNYTSISITTTGKLAFSNPNTNGTMVILKSQGNVTLTSSQAPMIDMRNVGAAGGSGGDGTTGTYFLGVTNGGVHSINANGGAAGAATTIQFNKSQFYKFYPWLIGAGGGMGDNGSTGSGSNGGNGGGALFIECGGAWNFTTTGGISTSGTVGVNGTSGPKGAGGGGGAGSCIVLYNTLTANSGTITSAGGAGGSSQTGGGSGGGGGSYSAGTAGGVSATGGTGGAGYSLVAPNIDFA